MMRVGFTLVALLVASAIVGARGGGGGQGSGPAPARAPGARVSYESDPAKTQTVRGCLKPAATAGFFAVTDAVEVKGGAESGSKQTYTIVGVIPPNVKLKDHVNHKVELAGNIIEGGKFDLADFKMVSATCT
jgi:hypothetical protein